MVTLTHRPTPGRLVQPFGPRPKPTPTSPAFHYGQDWGWLLTTTDPIYAAAGGTVAAYGDAGAYGRRLVITHDDGSAAWYCHTTRAHVPVGARVAAGDHIADIGMTGNVTGPHLHFEVRVKGAAVDPGPLFRLDAAPAAEELDRITEGIHEMSQSIMRAPNDVIVLVAPGRRENFDSPAEYNATRDIIAFQRSIGATDAPALPPIDKVPGVTWAQHALVCKYLGAPLS